MDGPARFPAEPPRADGDFSGCPGRGPARTMRGMQTVPFSDPWPDYSPPPEADVGPPPGHWSVWRALGACVLLVGTGFVAVVIAGAAALFTCGWGGDPSIEREALVATSKLYLLAAGIFAAGVLAVGAMRPSGTRLWPWLAVAAAPVAVAITMTLRNLYFLSAKDLLTYCQ
jgi:hypothetical protein